MLELREKIRNCTSCNLYKILPEGRKPIPGIGPIDAKIFCLAESPGREECILDEPLVGLCGKYFDKLLSSANIKRENCYISNVLHCRCTDNGKKNRPPKKEEIKTCSNWVIKEINIIKPRIIIGFGKVAAEFLLNRKVKKLENEVGCIQFSNYLPSHFICTYHPNYLLQYSKDKSNLTIKHLIEARKFAYE